MSTYTEYDVTATRYETTRVPVGTNVIVGCLTRCGRPPGELRVLDAGSGTGAYAKALAGRVGRIVALDPSDGMLRVARRTLRAAERGGRLTLIRGRVQSFPFADRSFDAVMFNQVLHHLETGEDADYPGHRRALEEAYRVLGPGGVVVISACSQEQLEGGFWYYHLIPEAVARVRRRCIPFDRLEDMLSAAGFAAYERIVAPDAVLQGAAYFDPTGPLRAAWRAGDSVWELVTPAELKRALAKVRQLARRRELSAYFARCDAARPRVGQVTFLSASRI
ncbi:MAG: methyltransferase domain-containing protein [Alphaproteobacteria bacterium]